MNTWQAEMLELLLEERQAGEPEFARAWRHARARCSTPRPRDLRRPFDEGDDWLPPSSFFRMACEREWENLVKADYIGLRELFEDRGDPARARGGTARVTLLS